MEQVNYNSGEVLESLNNKLDRDFNNMAVNSVNFAKYSNNVTNCITEIPQDIKLELVDGTLTLKAGSKVYDGNGLFHEILEDISNPSPNVDAQVVVMVTNDGLFTAWMGESVSELPEQSSTYKIFYNTTDKKCYFDTPDGWINCSFPIALATGTTTNWISIDQVFNGFGYIGSTVFALPEVKGLIPNGRNEDGSLKNIEIITPQVIVSTLTGESRDFVGMSFDSSNGYVLYRGNSSNYTYDEEKNININTPTNTQWNILPIGYTTGDITSFTPKLPFHAVDRNDSSWVAQQAMPSDKYTDLTLGASGTQYTAPANGWFHIAKVAGTADAHCTLVNTCVTGTEAQGGNYTIRMQASTSGMTIYLNLPVKKGDVAVINYTASGNTDAFRFIYAEGEN